MIDAPKFTDGTGGLTAPDQELITLTQAASLLPRIDGKKVRVSTIWRWCHIGLRGQRLDYVRIGRRVCTSREALGRFFDVLAEQDRQSPLSQVAQPRALRRRPITSRARQRAIAQADSVLERARF
jgi:hypothetical protein